MVPKLRRTLLSLVLCALFCLSPEARAVSTSASAAILMEAESGRVLYENNADTLLSIASTTKLMTALVAAKLAPDLDVTVYVDPSASGVEGSSIYLAPNEELTLRELLYGLLLQSGNDAAVAIAIACAGDVESFVNEMNRQAEALGMTGSHFANPNGLEAEGHYSCARDMAVLAQAVLREPVLAEIVSTKSYSFGKRTLVNHNKLLWRYPGCVGLKTGYTKKAGRTLVSAATRDGTTFIAVTLHDPNDWADHTALLDHGFALWHSHTLASQGKMLARIPVTNSLVRFVPVVTAQEVRYPLSEGEQVTARIRMAHQLRAPVEQGTPVGSLIFCLNGQEIGRTQLLAAAPAPDNGRSTVRHALGELSPRLSPLREKAPVYRGSICQILL